jgi:methylated-DNA-[protein]-cysteine S-methyltransferase
MSNKPKRNPTDVRDTFTKRVHQVVRAIAKGTVQSYQQVAIAAGSPRAARAVGSLMAKNFDPTIPCHRVVKSNGMIGDYNRGGARAKAQRLRSEGVATVRTATGVYISNSSNL